MKIHLFRRKLLVILSFIILCSSFSFAQKSKTKAIYKKLEEVSSRTTAKELDLFQVSERMNGNNEDYKNAVDEYLLLSLKEDNLAAFFGEEQPRIDMNIPMANGENVILQLFESQVTHESYTLQTSGTDIHQSVSKGRHYRGIIKGQMNSLASVSIYQNDVYVIFSNGNGDFNLGKIEDDSEEYILYNYNNLKKETILGCQNDDSIHNSTNHNRSTENAAQSNSTGNCKVLRLYWEADYDLYLNKGSVLATESYLIAIFNQTATLYQNDGMIIQLSGGLIWNTPDPYSDASSSTALDDFRISWNNMGNTYNGDLAHLVALDAGNFGGLAYVNSTLCNSRPSTYAYSDIDPTYATVPVYSFTVMVLAHETGHNLSSPHTQACAWNGNNTAIDGCVTAESINGNSCSNGPLPTGGGTIMSYCHNSVGINFNNGFHPQVLNQISNNINSSSCLSTTICTKDIYLSNVSVSNLNPSCNEAITVSFTHGYTGSQPSVNLSDINYTVYLSDNPTLDGTDEVILGSQSNLGSDVPAIAAGGTHVLSENLLAGTYYIIIIVDSNDELAETDETNNTSTIAINVSCEICEAGIITSTAPQSICPNETFNIILDGSQEAVGGFNIQYSNVGTDGTGGLDGGFYLSDFIASSFPYIADNDLNGVLSTNNFPVLEGTWNISVYALDGTGASCDITSSISITFLDSLNINCIPTCEAGIITSTAPQTICPNETFNIILDGSQEAVGGFNIQYSNVGTDGTGGLDGGFYLSDFIASSFP
ncbi:MAG: hypothetical protein ACI94Y_003070, partial [Maribacter sp.]